MATLTPEELRRQLPPPLPLGTNLLPPGSMAPDAAPAQSTYGQQMSNIGNFLLGGIGDAARFLVSAPGSGSPLAPGAAAAPAPAPRTANASTLAAADAANVPAVTPLQPAAAPAAAGAPRAPRAPRAAGAGAPALIPGETGYYNEANQLVPYGVSFPAPGAAGGAGAPMRGMPAGANNLIDPRSYFPDAVAQQLDYARAAANSILNMAGDGGQLGYSARLRALSSVYNNGLAQVGQGGANTFNSGIANILGSQASANATLGAAGINASTASADRALQREMLQEQFYATPRATGTELVPGLGGIPTPVTTYGLPQRGGGMAPISAGGEKAKPKEGAKQTYNGASYTYTQGQWKAD